MGRRHLARELALKVLFELETNGGEPERALQYHAAQFGEGVEDPVRQFADADLDGDAQVGTGPALHRVSVALAAARAVEDRSQTLRRILGFFCRRSPSTGP